MCLTEPHCGTDLGLLRTRAEPAGDGSYKVSGAKIFISAGEQDLTDNIVHLVLARLPDAPRGVKGISLFLVPKFLPDAAGAWSVRNGAHCTMIEHKMGIKASATCQMLFEEATGWLVGEPHRGLEAMFTMMNAERVGVGIQGSGSARRPISRRSGTPRNACRAVRCRGPSIPTSLQTPSSSIPTCAACCSPSGLGTKGVAASRAGSRARSTRKSTGNARVRQRAADLVALMTPVVKALFTDLGLESASLAVQCYGGHGFIRESGVEAVHARCADRHAL
jgi:alkylation response protein AidB-like acyl-CoA dehydrogenase